MVWYSYCSKLWWLFCSFPKILRIGLGIGLNGITFYEWVVALQSQWIIKSQMEVVEEVEYTPSVLKETKLFSTSYVSPKSYQYLSSHIPFLSLEILKHFS